MLSYRGYSGSTRRAQRARQRRRRQARLRGAAQGRASRPTTSSSTASCWARASPCRWRRRSRSAAWCSMRPTPRSSTWPQVSYPYLPVRPFMFDRYETMRYLPKVTAPLLVMHGEEDGSSRWPWASAVYAAANAPKEIVTFPRRRATPTTTSTARTRSCSAGSTARLTRAHGAARDDAARATANAPVSWSLRAHRKFVRRKCEIA